MRFIVIFIGCISFCYCKSPFAGNSFSMELLTEKSSVKTQRDFTVDENTVTKDGEVKISPKSFQLSLSNRMELSKHFMLITDSFLKINAASTSEESSEIKTKIGKGTFGYGIGMAIGMFTTPTNLISFGTFCENMTVNYDNLADDPENKDGANKSYSSKKFLNGVKIENFTAISKNKFLKISIYKPFNEKTAVFGQEHKVSMLSVGVGLSLKF